VWHRPHAQFKFAAVRPVSGGVTDSTARCLLLGKNRGGTVPLLRTCSRPQRWHASQLTPNVAAYFAAPQSAIGLVMVPPRTSLSIAGRSAGRAA
jgi:hypothetical protein